MNKTAFVCLALLLVSVSATNTMLEKYSFAFKSRRSIMNVMAQIESTIKSGGPQDAITRILGEFEQEIREEQVAHQELFDRQTVECNGEFEFRRQQISEANDAVHEAANTLESCQGQKARATSDHKQATSQLANARTSLGILNRKKIEWDYAYETYQHAGKLALEAFPECYRLLDMLDNGQTELVELTRHVTKMVPTVTKTRSMNKMNGVMAVLAQVSTGNVDKVAIEKVRSVLVGFEAELQRKIQQSQDDNAKFQNDFNESERKYKREIERLTQLLTDLEAELHQLASCISVQQGNLQSASEKLRRNTTLLNKAEAMCHSMGEQFEKATAARKDELDLLQAIKIKVEQRFAQISKGATERGNMSAEQLGEYDQLDYEHASFQG